MASTHSDIVTSDDPLVHRSTSSEESPPETPPAKDEEEDVEYPTGVRFYSIVIGLVLAVMCSNLDRSILGVATPKITAEFNSLEDVPWYGSAYLMMGSCSQLILGKVYATYNVKYTFLISLVIFEIGSILCAAAPDSICLIVGRAVAGIGATGIGTGALLIIAHSMPVHKRPAFTGLIGAGMCACIIIAPFLGGVFTDKVTWRWCFWINLPMGGVTIAVVFLFLHLPKKAHGQKKRIRNTREFFQELDIIGTFLIAPCFVCLLLALQWGGSKYAWNSWRIILLWVLFGLLAFTWGFHEWRLGDKSALPKHIITQRSMVPVMWFAFCSTAVLYINTYYVPIWFQAVKNVSAYQSGINLLATTVPMIVFFIITGVMTTKTGYYVPQLILGCIVSAISSGLAVRYEVGTSTVYWAASLVLAGMAFGLSAQQPVMVPQTVFKDGDIALGTSAVIFVQSISSCVFLFVCQNVFNKHLVIELGKHAPTVDASVVIANGASNLVASMSKIYSPDVVQEILTAYNQAMKPTWIIGVSLAAVGIFGATTVEWVNVKKDKKKAEEKEKGEKLEEGGQPKNMGEQTDGEKVAPES